jgi:hypothetical protein
VTVAPFTYQQDNKIKFVEGELPDYRTLTYYVDNEEYLTTLCEYQSTISNFPTPTKKNCTFKGWSKDGETIIDDICMIEDTSLYAIFDEYEVVYSGNFNTPTNSCYFSNIDNVYSYRFDFSKYTQFSNLSNLDPTKDKYSMDLSLSFALENDVDWYCDSTEKFTLTSIAYNEDNSVYTYAGSNNNIIKVSFSQGYIEIIDTYSSVKYDSVVTNISNITLYP